MSILLSTKTKILEERMKLHLIPLQQEVRNGSIQSPIELYYKLHEALQNIYLTMDKPSFTIREAKGAPISSDYNMMIEEAIEDLSSLYSELGNLAKAIIVEFKNIEIQRSNIQGKIKTLNNRVATLSTRAKEYSNMVEIFKETFASTDNYDISIVKDTPAEINIRAGVLTLATEDSSILEDLDISVVDCNGLPGNTHQVRAIDNKYKFYGEDGLHINLADAMDGNTDTWFEIEKFNISDSVRQDILGLGLDYIEGISWVDSGDLIIEIILEPRIAQLVNWVSIVPFIPADKGAIAPVVEYLILDDGKGLKSVITKDEMLNNDTVFLIPRQKVKRVLLRLRQSHGYSILAGHWAFIEPGERKGNQFGSVEESRLRVLGPMPSVGNLGVKYNPRTRGVDWLVYTKETIFEEQEIKNNLFSVSSDGLEIYLEAIKATRYQLGLREILLANYRFKSTSTFISDIWPAKNPINEIAIEANIQIPPQFGTSDWVRFYISIDDAANWHRIYPTSTIGTNLKKLYLINTNTPLEARLDNVGYIDSSEPIYKVRVKVELQRPEVAELDDADFYTPLVTEYNLKVTSRSV